MRIDANLPTAQPGVPQRAKSPDEAAKQFEEVLVKQFVQTMTKNLFKPMGDGPSHLSAQADIQRDTLNDVLTRQLVASGSFGVARMLERQWAQQGQINPDEHAESR